MSRCYSNGSDWPHRSTAFARWRQYVPHLTHCFTGSRKSGPNRLFFRFCRAHQCAQPTHTPRHSGWGNRPHYAMHAMRPNKKYYRRSLRRVCWLLLATKHKPMLLNVGPNGFRRRRAGYSLFRNFSGKMLTTLLGKVQQRLVKNLVQA